MPERPKLRHEDLEALETFRSVMGGGEFYNLRSWQEYQQEKKGIPITSNPIKNGLALADTLPKQKYWITCIEYPHRQHESKKGNRHG